ncbi:MAG: hypothetical protein K2W96_22505 [Gemmataceae bacterium]|nr:hypothetical protein [Gemmataceae bacterium]
MMAVFSWIGARLQDLVGLVMPLFSTENLAGMGRALWLILHVLLVSLIVVGLWYLDGYLRWYTIIPGNKSSLFVRGWLPLLFLLLYAMMLLSLLLWRLIVREEIVGGFPDLDAAWSQAVAALRQMGGKLDDLPLFLVLGQPKDGDEAFFRAAGKPFKMPKTPAGDPPVSLLATEDAFFVTCPGASVLGNLCRVLNSPIDRGPVGGGDHPETGTLPAGGDEQTMGIKDILVAAAAGAVGGGPVGERELRRIERQGQAFNPASRAADALETQSARLRHLCRLLVRDRKPYCAVNGLLVLLPFAGLDTLKDAEDAADACRRDLGTARQALGVHAPVLAALCDMESAPGFIDYVRCHKPDDRRRRLGQRTPLVPQLRGGAAPGMFRSLADWICQGFLRSSILQRCRLETAAGPTLEEALATNAQLFQLLCDMQGKREMLARVLEGFAEYAPPDKLLFGGCYLAATGTGGDQQAFVPGIVDRLMEGVGCVYWTDEVKRDESRMASMVAMGWALLAVLAVGAAALVGYAAWSRAKT